MTNDPWRYCCPHCGSQRFEVRIGSGHGRPAKNPEDRYRCNSCGQTFDERHDKKLGSGSPEEAEA